MTRKCECSGGCGPERSDVTRREFIEVVALGAAGAALARSGAAAERLPQQTAEELDRWKKALHEPAPARIYHSDLHTDARMHLGGIGTGNFEIGADGQITTWQLFNTLRDGHVPFYFALHTDRATKLLQTQGGPDWPKIERIEMTGEYPLATLRFQDKSLPVRLELTAFSPFAPLDTKLSSIPLAAFVFRVHNPTDREQTVSLAAILPNPVGYDAAGRIESASHPNFGGNVNEVYHDAGATGLFMRAEPGKEPELDRAVTIVTLPNQGALKTPPHHEPSDLHVEIQAQAIEAGKLAHPDHTILWLEDAPTDLSASWLRAARDAVQAGATLVFAGKKQPLLEQYAVASKGKPLAQAAAGRPDIVFEDFEHGYKNWTVEGTAFGDQPPSGTLPNQQPVSGFQGKGLVNSFKDGDDTTGQLISKPFTIERNFICFFVGGGSHGTTQIRLISGEKIVRATSGRNNERLEPASWNVSELQGQTAYIAIVDAQKGGWGHINVDQIEFSDQAVSRASLELVDELLPAHFSAVRPAPGSGNSVALAGLALKPGAARVTRKSGLVVVDQPLGKGHVMLALGSILDPADALLLGARHRAYGVLCELVGADYKAPQAVLAKA
ncbi:MAG TPA: GH116 family glycosyl-hydrolase, partial [Isosphaeraceae bacterium]|nr:GH116 family glycosyl-hydrolase [Isosphaeraceae bacterium]